MRIQLGGLVVIGLAFGAGWYTRGRREQKRRAY